MDLAAVIGGNSNILRRMERRALATATMAVEVSKVHGVQADCTLYKSRLTSHSGMYRCSIMVGCCHLDL